MKRMLPVLLSGAALLGYLAGYASKPVPQPLLNGHFDASMIPSAKAQEHKDEVMPFGFNSPQEPPLAPDAPPVIHIDGYRLSENRREWLEIGIPELLTQPGVKLIEWPKREFEQFEDSHVEVAIRVLDDGSREISAG